MIAIIIIGPPGSGKGTQAKLLAERLGLIHFDTGKYIEQVVHAPANRKNKIIQRERKLFDSGILCEPDWVLKIVGEKTKKLAEAGFGIVFSGSPRTFYESFGDEKQEGLVDVLEKHYGKKNIFIFKIDISAQNSIKRNGNRLLCSVCGIQLMATFKDVAKLKTCPFCGGKLYRRTLDKPETIKIRLKEYIERTLPIAAELKKRGYKIIRINGEPLPAKVSQSILEYMPH
jgi:adenylate kinase